MVESIVTACCKPEILMPAYLTDKATNFALCTLSSKCPSLARGLSSNKVIRRTKKQR